MSDILKMKDTRPERPHKTTEVCNDRIISMGKNNMVEAAEKRGW